MKYSILFLLLLAFCACEKDSAFELAKEIDSKEEIVPESIAKDGFTLDTSSPSPGTIYAAIVNEGPCGNKYNYSFYVAATKSHTKDRKVQAIIVKNGAFIEARIFTIPAGELVSDNSAIFNPAQTSYGRVASKVYNVLIDHEEISGYNFPTSSYNVKNCFYSGGGVSGDCSLGLYSYVEDNPSTAANESAGDQDGDGICNNLDLDDNDNNIPDDFED